MTMIEFQNGTIQVDVAVIVKGLGIAPRSSRWKCEGKIPRTVARLTNRSGTLKPRVCCASIARYDARIRR